jgi:hypothetical protein
LGAEPAPPAKDRSETYSHYDSLADLTAIDVVGAPSRVVLSARPPGWKGPGPAFARYSPSGQFLAYVIGARPGPSIGGVAQDVLNLGVVKVGETEPLHAEEISRYYVGRENYSGDYLGRAGVILAWHPTDDILLFLNGHRLRVKTARAVPSAEPSLWPPTGAGSTAITSHSSPAGARLSSTFSPRTRWTTATRSVRWGSFTAELLREANVRFHHHFGSSFDEEVPQ